MIWVRSSPAFPTNGRPVWSSVCPGPSPTNISFAVELPSPGTVWVRPSQRKHFRHPAIVRATSSRFSHAGAGSMRPRWGACTTRPGTVGRAGAPFLQSVGRKDGRLTGGVAGPRSARTAGRSAEWSPSRASPSDLASFRPSVFPSFPPSAIPSGFDRITSSPPSSRWISRYRVRSSAKPRLHPVENPFRDFRLAGEGKLPAASVPIQHRDPVGVHLEPRAGFQCVVDHDQIEPLPRELGACLGLGITRLQREPHGHAVRLTELRGPDRKSTRLNSSHG